MAADIYSLGANPNQQRKKLGQIFVARGILTEVSVRRLVEHAQHKNVRLGTLLETIGLVTPEELATALAIQYQCKTVANLDKYSYSSELLQIIPMETAVENTIFPLKVQNGMLGLAVADPTTDKLFQEISAKHKVKIIPFIATRSEINRAIARHYLGQKIEEANQKTILVVEDDNLMREVVAKMLMKDGYTVKTAVDGMEAFNTIFTIRPKLVITDKVMPKLNGYDFLHSVRNIPEFRYTPFILMTASANPNEEREALNKGFFDFIMKPVQEIGLLTRVQRALQSAEALYGKTGS